MVLPFWSALNVAPLHQNPCSEHIGWAQPARIRYWLTLWRRWRETYPFDYG